MALAITIGGTDRTSACKLETIEVVNTIAANSDTAEMVVSVSSTAGWRPKAGNPVVVTNGATKEFGGIVYEVTEMDFGLERLRYQVNARDYTYLFDKYLVVEEYASTRASGIVTNIVTSYTTGFTTTNVMTAPTVGAQTFDYIEPSQAVRQLADLVGYGFYIDYDKDVHFYSLASVSAPVASIDLDSDITNYGDMRITETVGHGVKNRNYIKGFKQKSSGTMTRAFAGDGVSKFFALGYEPASTSASDITGTVGASALSFGRDMRDSQPDNPVGGATDAYICFDNMGVRFDVTPSSTSLVSFTFKYMNEIPTVVEDTEAQSTMATREGVGDGVHEFAWNDPGLTAPDGTDNLALLKGREILTRYSRARLQTKFRSFTQGWRAGQSLQLISTRRMGGLNKTFYVQQVVKRIVNHPSGGSPTFTYDVALADSALAV